MGRCLPVAPADGGHQVVKIINILPCLVLVREPRIKRCGFDVCWRFDHFGHFTVTKEQLSHSYNPLLGNFY